LKASLTKPLAVTTALLALPLLGSVLVFGAAGHSTDEARIAVLGVQPATATPTEATVLPAVLPTPEARREALPLLEGLIGILDIGDPSEIGEPRFRAVEPPRVTLPTRERMQEALDVYLAAHRVHTSARSLGSAAKNWTPGANDVVAKLAERNAQLERDRATVRARLSSMPSTAEELAELTRFAYAKGAPDLAQAVHDSSDLLVSWDQAPIDLTVTATFRRHGGGGGDLELHLIRSSNLGQPLAVSFPPGTYGESVSASSATRSRTHRHSRRSFPRAQDLALLRAPVAVFAAGELEKTISVPVACASFGVASPRANHPYVLDTFPKGSAVSKLMVAMCAGEEKDDSQAQLAVWIARNDIPRDRFFQRAGTLRTFHGYERMGADDMRGAAELMLEGGLDPHSSQFFPRPIDEEPAEPVKREPVQPVEPEPAPTAPTPGAEPVIS
jgi:hypothetical protein